MNKIKSLLLLLVAFITLPSVAQQLPQLPIDKDVRYGKLPNGLTYYIRHNALPENRANFYIAQKVGSVQEEENQRGLAHFLEHMCFNGTDNFPDNRIIKYCESIGVKFGQNLNAYTSTDETVYNIDDVPVTESNVDSCLLILHDWSDGLTLDPKEIDKERGVIHEEWRMRSSASGRMFERNLPTLFPESRYGHRYPIGLMSVVDNFKPAELRAYYEKWYRPDLQGIIVVGDIDVDKVEQRIKAIFSPIQMPKNPAAYEHYSVPNNNAPIYVIDKDKEQTSAVIQLFFKQDPIPAELKNTPVFLQMNYTNTLISTMLNARLEELALKADCPFIGAATSYGNYIMTKMKDAFVVYVLPKPGQDAAAVQAVMQEVERARQFGFTATEAARASEEFMSSMERIYDNRDKQKHDFYVPQYVRHFLEGQPIPDIETEFNMYKMMAQQLQQQNMLTTLTNEVFKQYTANTDTNFVCLAFYPEKADVTVPTADQLKQAIAAAKAAKLDAYVDNVKNEPLVPVLPKKGNIKKEEKADFGYTCWTLANGARVFFKQTDFNDAEVQFFAQSFGGKSLVGNKDLVNLNIFDAVMSSTGLGNFSSTELQKKLAGKQASCMPSLGNTTDNLIGGSTPKDLRTLFELIYLRFQAPANDVEGYNNVMNYLKSNLENADKDPQTAFADSLRGTLYNHNPRMMPLKYADLAKADYEAVRRIYAERFNAAGDFDFFFTGAFNVDSLRLFVEQYIAPLKSIKKRENYNAKMLPEYAKGVKTNHFFRSMETPQAQIVQLWHGSNPYNMKEAATISVFGDILTKRYLKSIREDGGLAYSVGASASANYAPKEEYIMQVYCPVKPAKLDSALLLMKQGIEDIANKGVTADELDEVKKFELKDFADSQKKNGYWLNLITTKVLYGRDLQTNYEATMKGITSADIQKFAKSVLLKQNNCITVSMRPTDMTEKENTK